jgi:LCP family protein required for cell wall assembly
LKRKILIACLLVLLIGAIVIPKLIDPGPAGQSLTDEQIAAINAALDDESKEFPIEEQFRVTIQADDLSAAKGLNEDWLNILLLGTDTRGSELNNGRTDAMMVLSLHKGTGQMKLTSLIRDMLVTIPGYKIQNRINSANAFGGPLLAIKTVNELLGLNIERYCSINFPGFMDVVNYLGGVTLTLSAGEVRIVGAQRTDEPQVLDGGQALTYVRIRKIGSNFARNERQRKFLTAILDQVKKNNTDQIIDAVTAGFKAIATNLTTKEVIALLPTIISNADTLDMLSLPQEGTYKFATTKTGASVIEFKEEEARSAFHAFVYGKEQKLIGQ